MIGPEQESTAALFHSYVELPSSIPYKPDRWSRLQVLAAAELLRKGNITTAVFLGDDVPSDAHREPDAYGGLGARMAAQLHRNLPHLPDSAVVFIPVARSTREEIAGFKKLAQEQEREWTNLMAVGKEAHSKRIQRAIRRIFGRRNKAISVVSQESILAQYPRYANIIAAMKESPEETAFIKREHLINAIDMFPVIGGKLLDLMNTDRVKILESRLHRAWAGNPKILEE
jgi:hypothetical protein